jgi:hypothetical protein
MLHLGYHLPQAASLLHGIAAGAFQSLAVDTVRSLDKTMPLIGDPRPDRDHSCMHIATSFSMRIKAFDIPRPGVETGALGGMPI